MTASPPSSRRTPPALPQRLVWRTDMDALLGTDSDPVIARQLDVNVHQVRFRRQQLGIAPFRPRAARLKQVIAAQDLPPMPQVVMVAATNRFFSVEQPVNTRHGSALPDTEDKQLTAYLQQELEQLQSLSLTPPACPYCQSPQTVLRTRPDAYVRRPAFKCKHCLRRFNRLTGTPLAHLRQPELMPAFIAMLSQQIPYDEASRRLGLEYNAVQNWVKKFRLWLLLLDPAGQWEARVRLGIKTRPQIPCPRCGADGDKHFSGRDKAGQRQLRCPACGAGFSVHDAEQAAQQKLRLDIRHDPGAVAVKVKK